MPLDGAFEMRTALDGNGFVHDIAFYTSGGRQANFQPAHPTDHTPGDDHIIGNDLSLDGGILANCQKMCLNVAFDGTFDLNIASGFHMAGDDQV